MTTTINLSKPIGPPIILRCPSCNADVEVYPYTDPDPKATAWGWSSPDGECDHSTVSDLLPSHAPS